MPREREDEERAAIEKVGVAAADEVLARPPRERLDADIRAVARGHDRNAQAHAELGKVRWELGQDRADALAQVRAAQKELATAGSKEASAELDAWLAARVKP